MKKKTVLFADDEAGMREIVSDFLIADGFNIITAKDGREALDTFVSCDDIDLVILDVMMPHMDGYDTLKKIKQERDVPIILLTAKTGEYDELRGFNIGADEYIKKPFKPKILVARVNALLNRFGGKQSEGPVIAYDVAVDLGSHKASVSGKPIELTGKEMELLKYFIINKGIALSRDTILESVWGDDYDGDGRTVDTHVKKLRVKLGSKASLLKTVWGFGYKFEEDNT